MVRRREREAVAVSGSRRVHPVDLHGEHYPLLPGTTEAGIRATQVLADNSSILDDIMLYWLPNAATSAARLYWEQRRDDAGPAGPGEPNPVPAGFSIFPGEAVQASRRWIERRYASVVHYAQLGHGGHFAALEQPAVLTEEIRTTFRSQRGR
ncbi:hypothetical protein [Micromonospora antibiotica]|uniref:Epoxide hydrolase n=1 Tax=Micromonospora antibiotica TaxID=2807623 RepID=A0ABS3V3B0_9ACTN|nr:hypothetical protein [Micromonospora antibiotica]MBO4160068.1 hypothetical protein [Micromonospora antibiotica]